MPSTQRYCPDCDEYTMFGDIDMRCLECGHLFESDDPDRETDDIDDEDDDLEDDEDDEDYDDDTVFDEDE